MACGSLLESLSRSNPILPLGSFPLYLSDLSIAHKWPTIDPAEQMYTVPKEVGYFMCKPDIQQQGVMAQS